MRNLLSILLLSCSFSVMSQPIQLACSGQIITTTVFKNHPKMAEKNKRDFLRVNVIVDLTAKTLNIGDSYYTSNVVYPDLQINNSYYVVSNYWANPNKDYLFYSTLMSIDRYTGNYKFSHSSYSKDGVDITSTSEGNCQIGALWQPKF